MSSVVLLRARVLSHDGRQLIPQNSGCHSKASCSSDAHTRLLRARPPACVARRIAGKEREELLLEARVQRELRAVPASPAAALGILRSVIVEARAAFGHPLVSLGPLLIDIAGALRETQVRARLAARVRSLAAHLPALAGRTCQPLRAAVDAATRKSVVGFCEISPSLLVYSVKYQIDSRHKFLRFHAEFTTVS